MPRNELGKLRRSQAVTMYGPGAIVDFRAGGKGGASVSVVVAGLDLWDQRAKPEGLQNSQTAFEPRLQRVLGVDGFRLPPVTDTGRPGNTHGRRMDLVGVRFPRWLQCPRCHRLRQKWAEDEGDAAWYCGECTQEEERRVHVVPVRFVVACPKGHIDDFPWHFWVGHEDGCANAGNKMTSELVLKAEEGKAGLAGLILRCKKCGASRPMEGCFAEDALSGLGCRGLRPWLPEADEKCTEPNPPRALQRGASNVYFPVTESALAIPPWTNEIEGRLGVHWAPATRKLKEGKLRAFVEINDLNVHLKASVDDIVARIEKAVARLEDTSPERLRWEEYEQIATPGEKSVETEGTDFEIRHETVPKELERYFKSIVRVTRLREVRAFHAFTRIHPPSPEPEDRVYYAEITKEKKNWLPAIEVRGEGVFLDLNRETLARWEEQPTVKKRAEKLDHLFQRIWRERYPDKTKPPSRRISARFILVHTLAHAMLRQLSLDCGYSTASIRERIYVGHDDHDMAGLLLYTGTTDSDGTLGGLSRQSRPNRIQAVLDGALRSLQWCSSDPMCLSGIQATSEALNLVACHSCMLAPETSCEEFNRFLDRAMLVGLPEEEEVGFFRTLTA